MSTNTTPGPWVFDEDRFIVGSNGKIVVQYAGCGSHKADWPNKANKALVLAAPEMLSVLEYIASGKCLDTQKLAGEIVERIKKGNS